MYRRRKKRDRLEWEDAYDAGRNAAAEETNFAAWVPRLILLRFFYPNSGPCYRSIALKRSLLTPMTETVAPWFHTQYVVVGLGVQLRACVSRFNRVLFHLQYSPETSQYGTMPDSINSQPCDLDGPGSTYGFSLTEEPTTPARQRHQSMMAGNGVAPTSIYASSTLSGGSSEYSSSAGGGGGLVAGLAPGLRYSKAQEAAADGRAGRGALSPIMQHQDAGPVEEVPPTYGGVL